MVELGFYCSPNMLMDNETMSLVQEVIYCMSWEMPSFSNLETSDANKLKLMTMIKEEIQQAQIHKSKLEAKNG